MRVKLVFDSKVLLVLHSLVILATYHSYYLISDEIDINTKRLLSQSEIFLSLEMQQAISRTWVPLIS